MIISKKTKRKETFDGLITFLRFHPFGVVFYNLVAPTVELKTEVSGYLSGGNSVRLDSCLLYHPTAGDYVCRVSGHGKV